MKMFKISMERYLLVGALLLFPIWSLATSFEARTIDGTGNNLIDMSLGSTFTPLTRISPVGYDDGASTPAGPLRKSAREISNILSEQLSSVTNAYNLSDYFWQWGQFLDHDIDLTESLAAEPFFIPVPMGDPHFDPTSTGIEVILLFRSIHDGGNTILNPREQLNGITSFIDASNVYGSDSIRAAELRTFNKGKLLTSAQKLLPFNTAGLPNAGGPDPALFLAGDVRVNEQMALTAMHTLFLREHNRLAKKIRLADQGLTDEEIYQRARKIVGAYMQVITYNEFLPLLLGVAAIPPYTGYDNSVDPMIINEFSTAAYRFGHSMLSPDLLRIHKNGKAKFVDLADAFFNPELFVKQGGVYSLLLGLAKQEAQALDSLVVDAVRNFLFGPPGAGGFDLPALNLQRGRDHGLSDYNSVRFALGLPKVVSYGAITSDPVLATKIASAYPDIDDMDLWVVGLTEDKVTGSVLGETFHTIIREQFIRLRDGDRFWYENDNYFLDNPELLEDVKETTLADIIRRNTHIDDELQDNVFIVD